MPRDDDPQPDHGKDEEHARQEAAAILADPRYLKPAHPGKPSPQDEEAIASNPPWHDDPKHPGPKGWHREPDPEGGEPIWVEDT